MKWAEPSCTMLWKSAIIGMINSALYKQNKPYNFTKITHKGTSTHFYACLTILTSRHHQHVALPVLRNCESFLRRNWFNWFNVLKNFVFPLHYLSDSYFISVHLKTLTVSIASRAAAAVTRWLYQSATGSFTYSTIFCAALSPIHNNISVPSLDMSSLWS